jgi:hypothetical protein
MLSLPKSYNRHCGKILTIASVVLALLLAIAIAPSVTLAQDNGSHKLNDPTGAWLIRGSEGQFILTVFHKGGTLTGDTQGESAFDPASTNPPKTLFNVINSPESGVWHKTGRNTFAATFLTMEYQVDSAFRWRYCQTPLTPCPFPQFPQRLRPSNGSRKIILSSARSSKESPV